MHGHACTYTKIHAYIHIYMHICTYILTFTYRHMCAHHTHTHTYAHGYMYTYIHTVGKEKDAAILGNFFSWNNQKQREKITKTRMHACMSKNKNQDIKIVKRGEKCENNWMQSCVTIKTKSQTQLYPDVWKFVF